ncbi:MAG: hypothetical protein KAS32_07435, partial [Candidatus Peribacteraceae bacterium]|nr:hypothetical protein [Candidatus Peribacteraceae bacterium]
LKFVRNVRYHPDAVDHLVPAAGSPAEGSKIGMIAIGVAAVGGILIAIVGIARLKNRNTSRRGRGR